MMKAEEIREWDNVEVLARLEELKEEQFRLRFRTGTMDLENPKMLQHIRRDIARLYTILRERDMAGGSAESTAESATAESTASTAQSEESTE
jgi:large subunit ribosomal protein L29